MARIVSTQFEKASQLEQRIDLAREIHEGVIQRLFGSRWRSTETVSSPSGLAHRCAEETQAALSDLRAALQRPLGAPARATGTTLAAELERLAGATATWGWRRGGRPRRCSAGALESLAQSVPIEAVRNAYKHAGRPGSASGLGRANGAFWMEVSNDGVPGGRRHAGMGLRWPRWRHCSSTA